MLKTQEQLHMNIEEVGGSFKGCQADIMDRVMFIIKHEHCECCSYFITPNQWLYIFGRRLAIALALHVLNAELIKSMGNFGMLDADEEGRYTVPDDCRKYTVETWEEFFLSERAVLTV